jgi:hypothetical protein
MDLMVSPIRTRLKLGTLTTMAGGLTTPLGGPTTPVV